MNPGTSLQRLLTILQEKNSSLAWEKAQEACP